MWKSIIVGTTALAIIGGSLVHAQQFDRRGEDQRWQPSAQDLQAFSEARLAALKAGLMLTNDQARNWPAFEQAARELAKQRLDHRLAMRNASPGNDPVERLRQRASAMSNTGAALKKLADTADPLYKSLDENQKHRFAMLYPLRHGFGRFRHGGFGRFDHGGSGEFHHREAWHGGSGDQRP